MSTDRGKMDRSELTRQAFREACGSSEPELGRIKEAFPEMVAEAARIRASASGLDPIVSIGLLARGMLPRLATAAALLVLVVTIVGLRDVPVAQTSDVEIESLILTGEIDDSVSDLLLESVTGEGKDNG